VDLLGHIQQENRNKGYPHQKSSLETFWRHAKTLLLGWVHSSLDLVDENRNECLSSI
jgi:hypothetical protein